MIFGERDRESERASARESERARERESERERKRRFSDTEAGRVCLFVCLVHFKPLTCSLVRWDFIHTLEIIARILSEVVNRERLHSFVCFVCLFVVIKPKKLYSASFFWREVKPLFVCLFVCWYKTRKTILHLLSCKRELHCVYACMLGLHPHSGDCCSYFRLALSTS